MVYYDLFVKVDGENIYTLHLPAQGYDWLLTVQCTCDQQHNCQFNEDDEVESENSKGIFNFHKKCKECKKDISITVYGKGDKAIFCDGKFGLLKSFDCRNCTPINWTPTPTLIIQTEAQSQFKNVELDENWCDYDEKAKLSCVITGYEVKFERNKTIDK